jgi:hypothetical protein
MQPEIRKSLICSLWLRGFGLIKIQVLGSLFYKTKGLEGYLCHQDTALCSKCGADKIWI